MKGAGSRQALHICLLFLTAMIWQLRKCLPKYFSFSLFDADPSFNIAILRYLFLCFN